jgi:hypothetical protein
MVDHQYGADVYASWLANGFKSCRGKRRRSHGRRRQSRRAVHHGRVVKRTGDGSIIEFRSVVDAVRCAIEVQNRVIERNAGVPADRRVEFRVGIHVGDAMAGSMRSLRRPGRRASVRSSSAPANRLYPTTSATKIAASFRVSPTALPVSGWPDEASRRRRQTRQTQSL